MNIKIGKTPMIKIKYKYNNKEGYIYSKLEYYSISGSIKDRVAYYILEKAYGNNMYVVQEEEKQKLVN